MSLLQLLFWLLTRCNYLNELCQVMRSKKQQSCLCLLKKLRDYFILLSDTKAEKAPESSRDWSGRDQILSNIKQFRIHGWIELHKSTSNSFAKPKIISISASDSFIRKELFKGETYKDHLRSTTGQSKLSNIAISSIKRELVDAINFDLQVRSFENQKTESYELIEIYSLSDEKLVYLFELIFIALFHLWKYFHLHLSTSPTLFGSLLIMHVRSIYACNITIKFNVKIYVYSVGKSSQVQFVFTSHILFRKNFVLLWSYEWLNT